MRELAITIGSESGTLRVSNELSDEEIDNLLEQVIFKGDSRTKTWVDA